MSRADRLASAITDHTRAVILITLFVLIVTAAGVGMVGADSSLEQFQSDSPEAEALTYIEDNFESEAETTSAQIVIRGENILSQESLLTMLTYQRELRENEAIRETLVEEGAMTSVANTVAIGLLQQDQPDQEPEDLDPEDVAEQGETQQATLDEQIQRLEAASDEEVAEVIEQVLGESGGTEGTISPLGLLPTDYQPGAQSADATIMVVTQQSDTEAGFEGAAGPKTTQAQLEMRTIGEQTDSDLEFLVVGSGIISHEIDNSMADSLLIVGPLALLFVLTALAIAYRDVLDIVLGTLGIVAVLLATFGFMGWTGIAFGQIFVAVPVLLIGLSIDYAIHLFMRHREEREDGDAVRASMGVALVGVGTAFVLVTATTAVGFLSNVTSPVAPIQEFGIISAAGIGFALLVFGLLIPAVKIELDELLEARGYPRQKRAFGTGGGRASRGLSLGASGARTAPLVILAIVAVLAGAGVYGGLQVDTSFEQEDFLADDPPEWMKQLPEPFTPEQYTVKSTLQFLDERFTRAGASSEVLIRGEVTDEQTLERLDTAEQTAADQPVTQKLPDGSAGVDSPLLLMRTVAATNESFNESFRAAGGSFDSAPDRDIEALYDELFEVAPQEANRFIAKEDGEYRALRMTVAIQGGSNDRDVTDQMRTVATTMNGNGLTATATGATILNVIVQDQLLETVLGSLLITLVVVFVFLSLVYRVSDGSALLGPVTLLPVVLAAAWIVGTMYLLGIPFNVMTGTILSLTIGLGVAYSIHLSERYTLELQRQQDVWQAMQSAVTGTGGALLGSAATTVGGFGVLVFAILPPLRQFGLITALSITYAFIATVFVLPTLLALWTRVAGPEWAREQLDSQESTLPTTDEQHND